MRLKLAIIYAFYYYRVSHYAPQNTDNKKAASSAWEKNLLVYSFEFKQKKGEFMLFRSFAALDAIWAYFLILQKKFKIVHKK